MRVPKDRRRGKAKKKSKPKRRWLRRIGYVAIGFVLASVLLVLPLRWIDPVTTAFMLQDRSGRVPVQYDWVDWDQISDGAKLAVVASEDQRFADHLGLDLKAIQKAVDEKDERGYLRGASTISQQTAKNLFLWPGRNLLRKGLEAWFTVVLEACLPKRRILEIYLNIVELGPGVYGVDAAGRQFFSKAAGGLTDREAALLAAVLPNPKRLNAAAPSDYLLERQRWIVSQIKRLRREAWLTRIEN